MNLWTQHFQIFGSKSFLIKTMPNIKPVVSIITFMVYWNVIYVFLLSFRIFNSFWKSTTTKKVVCPPSIILTWGPIIYRRIAHPYSGCFPRYWEFWREFASTSSTRRPGRKEREPIINFSSCLNFSDLGMQWKEKWPGV